MSHVYMTVFGRDTVLGREYTTKNPKVPESARKHPQVPANARKRHTTAVPLALAALLCHRLRARFIRPRGLGSRARREAASPVPVAHSRPRPFEGRVRGGRRCTPPTIRSGVAVRRTLCPIRQHRLGGVDPGWPGRGRKCETHNPRKTPPVFFNTPSPLGGSPPVTADTSCSITTH